MTTRLRSTFPCPTHPTWSLLLPLLLGAAGCEENYITENIYMGAAGSGGEAGDGGVSGAAGESTNAYPDAPKPDTVVQDLEFDLFGVIGHKFWFAVNDDQLERMNALEDIWNQGDLYYPGGDGAVTYADHLFLTTATERPRTVDLGRVQVKVVGQSTRRLWSPSTIPNLNLDTNEFTEDTKLDGFEHLRFNNAQVGSIFRERLTLEILNNLDYPAPLTSYAWVASNVWGADVQIPYMLVERYKPHFCERWQDQLGGSCPNMWEFVGDFNGGWWGGGPLPLDVAVGEVPSVFDDPNNCQFLTCDSSRVKELERTLRDVPFGEGFKAALADYVDWPSFHRFQCLSWILVVGDDALHNQNNVVLVERGDGKFQYLFYSVDISLGQSWYPVVPLYGMNQLANGCQSDPECWEDTISICEEEIEAFTDLDPVGMLDQLNEQLSDAGMLRPGDDGRYEELRSWLDNRLETLGEELETFREPPPPPLVCPDGEWDCGDGTCSVGGICGLVCAPPGEPIEGLPECPVEDLPVR